MNDTVPTPLDDSEIARRLRAILARPDSDESKIEQIRELIEPRWTDTGSGAGYTEPYDPRD